MGVSENGDKIGGLAQGLARGAMTDAVAQFASHVVATLAARHQISRDQVRESLLLRLIEAVTAEDPAAAVTLIDTLRAQNVQPEVLTDLYLPAAARALGEAWERDTADFVDVTIGTMRLQAILRGLSVDEVLAAHNGPIAGSILLIVPKGEQHTLGAMVVAAQLRRRRVSVCLQIMPRTNELREVLRNRSFDGIMISVGSRENLDLAGKMVDFLKKVPECRIPIVIGGALLPRCEDLRALTGADVATNDPDVALEACGLAGALGGEFSGAKTR